MTDLRKAAEDLLEGVEAAIKSGDWKVDGACDPDSAIVRLRQALAQPVDAVNMSQERVDETAKRKHEPWPSVQCVCGGTIYFKYTPPVSDYHEGWEEGFKAATREQEPFIYVREDNERPFGGYEHCSEADAGAFPVYTAPPKREWAGLTDEEIIKCFDSVAFGQVEDDLIINKHVNIFRAIHGIEAKLKEKNNG